MIDESGSSPPLTETLLKDLRAPGPAAAIVARVVSANYREVTRKSDGSRRPVLSGLLTDGTATVRFTWWDPPRQGVDRGIVLRATNVGVQEYQGRVELTFNWKSRVEPASEVDLPTVDPKELPLRRLTELTAQDSDFRLEVRVVRVEAKSVTVGSERRQIHEGVLLDGSGPLAFTSWTEFALGPGEAIRIFGAYVRLFRRRPQIVLDERSRVERFDGEGLPYIGRESSPLLRSAADLERSLGGDFVAVEGLVLGLLPPSGIVYRCPSCPRTLRSGSCRIHGAVRGEPDLRARLILDDGTGAVTANLGRAATERLFGRTLAECLQELRLEPDPSKLEAELFERTFGERIRLEGRAVKDDFGITFYPDLVRPTRIDPRQQMGAVEERLSEAHP
jgi:ssDNA-binding replication factor A large subunit